MAGIQLTGLASGMDWKTTVDQLMKIEQIPQDNLKTKKAAAAKVSSAFDTLKTNLTAFQTAAQGLQTGLSGYPRTATVSSASSYGESRTYSATSDASVVTSSGAALGSFLFNVTSMGQASSLRGKAKLLVPTEDAAVGTKLSAYGVTAGTFTVNGTKYTISDADLNKTVGEFFNLSRQGPTNTYVGNSVNGVSAGLGLNVSIDSTVSSVTDAGGNSVTVPADTFGTLKLDAASSLGAAGDTSNLLSALGLSFSPSDSPSDPSSDSVPVSYKQALPSSMLANLTLGQLYGFDGSGLGTGSGTLIVNGTDLSSSFSSATTVGSLISTINGRSETGVTASIDAVSRGLKLTSNAIGASKISVTSDNVGLKSLLGFLPENLVVGNGVEYQLKHDKVELTGTSDSTTIDLSKYGFGSTQLNVSNTGVFSVQVTGSGAGYKSKINTFISAYNSLKQMLDDSTKITVAADGTVQASVFSNRADINNLISTIRSKIYSSVSGAGVSTLYDSASKIGIGFDSSGVLAITDSTKLDAALANSPSSVDALFNLNKTAPLSTPSSGLGISSRINNLMTVLTGTKGMVESAKNSITGQTLRLQSQIDALTRSLAMTRTSLERGFIAMEKAQSKYQSMTQQLTAAFK